MHEYPPQYIKHCNATTMHSPHAFIVFFFCTNILSYTRGECGIRVIERGIEYKSIRDIIRLHNQIRSMAAKGEIPGHPRAVNMKTMKWDAKLALSAQEVADSCRVRHMLMEDGRFDIVGQNMLLTKIWSNTGHWSNGSNWNDTIDRWYRQYDECDFYDVTNCMHYAQLVTAYSVYVGCGYIAYQTSRHYENKFYVCHYGPGLDVMGLPPYRTGRKHSIRRQLRYRP